MMSIAAVGRSAPPDGGVAEPEARGVPEPEARGVPEPEAPPAEDADGLTEADAAALVVAASCGPEVHAASPISSSTTPGAADRLGRPADRILREDPLLTARSLGFARRLGRAVHCGGSIIAPERGARRSDHPETPGTRPLIVVADHDPRPRKPR